MRQIIFAFVFFLLAVPLGAQERRTDLPMIRNADHDIPDAQDSVFFADFVVGPGWSFQIVVSNNSPTRVLTGLLAVVVDPSTPGASTWSEALDDGSIPFFVIPPGGTKIFDEWTSPTDALVRGGVVIAQLSGADFFDDTPMLNAILTYRNDETGVEVSVPALRDDFLEAPFRNQELAFAIYVEETEAIGSGLALWKEPNNEVCMHLLDLDGEYFLHPNGMYNTMCYAQKYGDEFVHSAALLPEWFPEWDFSDGFKGTLVIYVEDNTFGRDNDGFTIPLGLRLGKANGSLSAVPVVPITKQ